ncbi:hypothetical protein [Streptococcus merionis]|uniref:Uncharacterized protein n=1 Tax=Streptococcus merionis TaxID=400065 RepID=A0A239SPY3_9STRE|nr:hypothetical protein [Streptococcus merionis]SNU87322.1 Uncharacterised protein [Streptococcus merionis]
MRIPIRYIPFIIVFAVVVFGAAAIIINYQNKKLIEAGIMRKRALYFFKRKYIFKSKLLDLKSIYDAIDKSYMDSEGIVCQLKESQSSIVMWGKSVDNETTVVFTSKGGKNYDVEFEFYVEDVEGYPIERYINVFLTSVEKAFEQLDPDYKGSSEPFLK